MKSIFPFKQHAKWSIMSNKTMEVHGHVVHLCFFFLFHCCALKSFQYNDEKRGFSTSFIHLIPLGIKSTSVSQEATTRDAAVVVFLLRVCSVGWGTVIEKKNQEMLDRLRAIRELLALDCRKLRLPWLAILQLWLAHLNPAGKGAGVKKLGKNGSKKRSLRNKLDTRNKRKDRDLLFFFPPLSTFFFSPHQHKTTSIVKFLPFFHFTYDLHVTSSFPDSDWYASISRSILYRQQIQ